MPNDLELDLIAVLESEFKVLSHDARVHVLHWAIAWANDNTKPGRPYDRALDAAHDIIKTEFRETTQRIRNSAAGVPSVRPVPEPPQLQFVREPRAWQGPRRKPPHCSSCGDAGHKRPRCPTRNRHGAGIEVRLVEQPEVARLREFSDSIGFFDDKDAKEQP